MGLWGGSGRALSSRSRAGWGSLSSKILQAVICRPWCPHRPPKPPGSRQHGSRQPRASGKVSAMVRGLFPHPLCPPPVGSPQASSTRACLCPLAPVGMQRASGKLQELPKHLVTLLILLINAYRCQQHGNGCLGTGVGARSGEFYGWIVATQEKQAGF